MKLEDAKDIVLKAKFKTCPVKMLMNVRINNLDADTSNEIINKYEGCIEALKSKIPNVAIYVNSIFLRNDNKFYNETIEVNTYMENYSKLHFINNCNIENNQMFDAKHLNKSGLFTMITNLKYVLFGFLPRFNNQRNNRNNKYGQHRHYSNRNHNNEYGRF